MLTLLNSILITFVTNSAHKDTSSHGAKLLHKGGGDKVKGKGKGYTAISASEGS